MAVKNIQFFVLGFLLLFFSCTESDSVNRIPSTDKPKVDENPQKDMLYNGIKLPEIWPPFQTISMLEKGMPVPYLESPPDTINISIGRQLFVDNFLIDITNLTRQFHYPEYHAANPVLVPVESWEMSGEDGAFAAPFSDGVWYDETEGKFKLWYLAGGKEYVEGRGAGITCYAESTDGINWTKPDLEIVPGTNIVDKDEQRDASTVWIDKGEEDPLKRYKMFLVMRDPEIDKWVYSYKYSADGISWKKTYYKSGVIGDRSTVFQNPFRDNWVFSIRRNYRLNNGKLVRARDYLESIYPDAGVEAAHATGEEGTGSVGLWFGPWPNEHHHPSFPNIDPAIYNHDAIAYESLLLGFFSVWMGPENDVAESLGIPKRNEVMVGYSRDGFHWDRPDMNAFLPVNGSENSWNYGNVQSVAGAPVIVNDKIFFYVSGRRKHDASWSGFTTTGLATLRRDGFASMDALDSEGTLLTRAFQFDGKHLFVNANVTGTLTAEILDESGEAIPGYSHSDCIPNKGDNTKAIMRWKGKNDLSEIESEIIRIRFNISNGSLYSFWLSKWETGESYGYTAGGGPGLHESGQDKK